MRSLLVVVMVAALSMGAAAGSGAASAARSPVTRAPGAAPPAASDAPTASDANGGRGDAADLAPSTAPPWNPSAAVPRRKTWENVVLFPGRVISLPLSGLGRLTDRALLQGEQSGLVPTRVGFAP